MKANTNLFDIISKSTYNIKVTKKPQDEEGKEYEELGTCFAFDYNGKLFFITAGHVLKNIANNTCKIRNKEKIYEDVAIKIIAVEENPDVAVFCMEDNTDRDIGNIQYSTNVYQGQELYYCGYPFFPNINGKNTTPTLFIKKGILSAIMIRNKSPYFLIDGTSSPGISGGPVFYFNEITQSVVVIGIITGFECLYGNIVDGKMYYPISGYNAQYHSGTSIAWGISTAIRLIEEYKDNYKL